MRLRPPPGRIRRGPGPWLLAAGVLGWTLMLASGSGHASVAGFITLCSGAEIAWPVPGAIGSGGHRPGALAWLAMMLAMAPLLRAEAGSLWAGSLPRRRPVALSAFAGAFALPWLALGIAALALPAPAPVVAAGAGLVAAWSCAPLRQRCLNACHVRPPVRAFGPAMLVDAGRWGLRNGTLCAATCGPAMLLAASLPLHLPAMAAAILLATVERARPPLPPAWRLPLGRPPPPWEARTMPRPPRPAPS